jgi:hypothetical protein
VQDTTKTILMSLTDSLNRVAENIALLSRTLLKEDALTPPAYVVAAQEVLDVANATMDKAVKQNEEATLKTTEENSEETLEVGSQVKYVGDRESLKGQLGAVVEVKERGWVVVVWNNGDTKSARTNELELFGGQPPQEEPAEENSEEPVEEPTPTRIEEKSTTEDIVLDEDAANYQIPTGLYAKFASIHHIYKASEKDRKWLRFRASKPLNCETTQSMCQRYLVSVKDSEYLSMLQEVVL